MLVKCGFSKPLNQKCVARYVQPDTLIVIGFTDSAKPRAEGKKYLNLVHADGVWKNLD